MWQETTILPTFSNREDYLLTLAMFDDDTLEPIDLSGITLANTGANFTASAWTVTDGAITTTSSTQITIPMFPVIGANNLTALSLVVGEGLAISQGDPVQITDTLTKKNIIPGFVASYTPGNGSLTVQIGWTFQFEVRRGGPRNTGSGFIPWWDWGVPDDMGPLLSANFGNGFLSLIAPNVVQILIPERVVRTLGGTSEFSSRADGPGAYQACMTGTNSSDTRQFLIGQQRFSHGGVTL